MVVNDIGHFDLSGFCDWVCPPVKLDYQGPRFVELRVHLNDRFFCADKRFARTKGNKRRTQGQNSRSACREDQGRKVSLAESKGCSAS